MEYIVPICVYFIYFFVKSSKTLQYLQQNRYNRGNKYIKYINSHLKHTFLNAEILFIPLFIILYYIDSDIIYGFACIYALLLGIKVYTLRVEQKKLPLKYTFRIIRLYITLILIYSSIMILGYYFIDNDLILGFILWLFMYLDHYVVILANIINIPAEKLVGLYYKSKALKKLKSMSNMKVIGITGSYGKTSSKNILSDILNIKYNAMPTPKNFNTPYGLMMTINNNLDKFNDYFIAEMGACKTGEIKELCDLVHPSYGILTKIGVAHLETFGSIENIQKTKFELIESLPSDGVGVLNIDDPMQVNYNGNFKCNILWIGIENKDADVYASNIKLSKDGTSFKVKFKGDKKSYEFTTKLLGKANIYNILAGLALGNYLGISKEMLIQAVKMVKPVEHRLELKKYYDMYLIDDAYNANPDGCNMAIDVLNMMPGKKIVISSGMIELGDLSDEIHYNYGKYISDKVDEVILIGKEQTSKIKAGLIDSKFKNDNIHVLNNVLDAFNLVNELKGKETYILLQSDLPDIFNEK
jgi:UDP-N-acetylmuramoyl-tripeptide--D-alanyl-D-alanine ligase